VRGDAALAARETGYAVKTLRRTPQALVFGVAFPIVLLLLFHWIFSRGTDRTTPFLGGRIPHDAYYAAGMIAYGIVMTAFAVLVVSVTTQRERGQLKRLRGTPMPPWAFVTAQILRAAIAITLTTVAILVVASVALDVSVPTHRLPALFVYVLLGTATMCTLALAATALMPTAEAASSAAPFSVVILSFISGVFVPAADLPDWLREIGRVFPLAHLAEGLQRSLYNGPGISAFDAENVAVLAVWALAGLVLAVRCFRWAPSASRS